MRASAVFDEMVDESAPALLQIDSTGGASLFKDMAACPFRAFANTVWPPGRSKTPISD